ncbi:MAG: YtxH domain-containing protein [Microterricola sp.]
MKGKLLFVSGAAVGYVLGTRAGRKRYEQIKGAAQSVWNTPIVQQGVDQVKGFALARVGTVSDAFFDNAKKLVNAATKQSTGEATITTVVTTVGTPAPATATTSAAKPTAAKPRAAKSAAKTTPKADG